MIRKAILAGLFAIGLTQTGQTASACNWNCGGTFTKGTSFGLTAPSHSGFQKHIFFNMPKKEHSYEYIKDTSKARAGNFYQRFEVRDGDCFPSPDGGWNDCETDRERFEFSSRPRQKIEGMQCYGFSLKLDAEFESAGPTNTTLGQVHQLGGPKGSAGGFKSFPPLVQFNIRYNRFLFGWHELTGDENNIKDQEREFELAKIDELKGKWTDVSVCLDFKNKRMDAWVNGTKKVEILRSPINFMPESIYFKYGIYRSFISKYKKFNGKMPTQIVYYDEVRRGDSVENVDVNINPELKIVD